tara:strand:+ start:757 stop:969 length:213 start_codon:yes stop_codon:yes gene_type:complete
MTEAKEPCFYCHQVQKIEEINRTRTRRFITNTLYHKKRYASTAASKKKSTSQPQYVQPSIRNGRAVNARR